jgi:hypothetical protein
MSVQQPERERLAELAVGTGLGDLAPEEAAEYSVLLGRHGFAEEFLSMRALGAALQATLGELEPMPASLAARIERTAYRRLESAPAPPGSLPRRKRARDRLFAYGGWVAAAASLLVAVSVWRLLPVRVPQEALNPSAERASLLASGRAVLKGDWSAGGDLSGLAVHGDVVWDQARQTGYMRFSGLARNNPRQEQYQLWIFDQQRDQRYPVDGGTFNVTASGDVVVRIQARLRVDSPTLFAVTVERPGGVVVSSRARMAAVAHPG